MSREFSALGATLLPTTDKADNAAKEAAAIDHIAQFASENNKAGDQLENAELKPDAEHFLDLLLKDRLKAGGSTDQFLQKLKARLGEPGASMGRATDNLLVAIENQQKALARVRIPSAPPSVTRTRIPSAPPSVTRTRIPSVEVPAPKTVAAMKYIPNFCSLPGDSAPPRRLVQSVIYQPPALILATASDSGPRRPTLRSVIAPAPADTVAKDVEAEVKTEVMTSVDSSVRDNVQQSVEDSMEDAMSDAFED